jgi:hypothetical protein
MRKIILIFVISFLPLFISGAKNYSSSGDSYDIEKIYTMIELEDDEVAIDYLDNIVEDLTHILVPTELKLGTYKVELEIIDYDYFKVVGTDIVVKTRYCYEYPVYDEVILNVTSNYGYTLGKVVFID